MLLDMNRELSIARDAPYSDEPCFRLLTAEGRVPSRSCGCRGPGALEIVHKVFRPIGVLPGTKARSGGCGWGESGRGLGDEVVAVLLKTDVAAVELQCHGGTAAVSLILEALESAGAKRCSRWAIPGYDFPRGDALLRTRWTTFRGPRR